MADLPKSSYVISPLPYDDTVKQLHILLSDFAIAAGSLALAVRENVECGCKARYGHSLKLGRSLYYHGTTSTGLELCAAS